MVVVVVEDVVEAEVVIAEVEMVEAVVEIVDVVVVEREEVVEAETAEMVGEIEIEVIVKNFYSALHNKYIISLI
jgi:hypothetical protein